MMSKQTIYRQKYNGRRRILAAQDRENRFVIDYLQHKHPDIYKDVKKIYADLRTRYQTKHDVRKTREYEELISGAPARKYKYNRHLTIKDNMVLTIELSDKPDDIQSTAPVDVVPFDAPVDVVPFDAPVDVAPVDVAPFDAPVDVVPFDAPVDVVLFDAPVDVAPVDVVPFDAPVDIQVDALSDTTIQEADLTLPYMSDETMGKLIEDLRQDPTMASIFDSMDGIFDNILW